MTQNYKPRILILCDFYLPGYKSGGGMRTLVNMVERLGDKFDFWIVTRDHDGWADRTQYKNVKINDWNQIGKARVYYLSKDKIRLEKVKRLVEEVQPKSIYLNSYFSTLTIFALLLRKFGKIRRLPIILAPEGELMPGALNLKKGKKQMYLKLARALRLYENIIWKTTADFEKEQVESVKGAGGEVFIAPNMQPKQIFPEFDIKNKPAKKTGELKLVFLSRLHPKKNLKFLLEILPEITDKVFLDVYGPVDNQEYVKECKKIIETLPSNIKVEIKGEISHEFVTGTLEKYHFFVLPTLGENFGHIVAEALAAGCPLIISDKTPWRNLEEKGIGRDLPLDDKKRWIQVLKYCINLEETEYLKLAAQARSYLNRWLEETTIEEDTEKVLKYSLSIT